MEGGPDAGKSHLVNGRSTIGSLNGLELTLTDTTVSPRHVELVPCGDALLVRDLASRSGTYIGAIRLKEVIIEQETVLHLGASAVRIVPRDTGSGNPMSRTVFRGVIGAAPSMQRLLYALARIAQTDSTVVLRGETGTGKDVLARSIHDSSPRSKQPFVVVDCGAVAPSLIESELFGHVRGAFTGALTARDGAFLQADHGTLFLDELGELPLGLQPKLLRVLEAGTLRRVGEDVDRRVNVRIIAATHRDLERETQEGRFRSDLYFRLSVLMLRIPPLRERLEDIPLLADRFLAETPGTDVKLTDDVLAALQLHPWPGNVRELRNAIERLVGLGSADAWLRGASESLRPVATLSERERILAALAECGGNQTAAARLLGVSRRTLTSRLNQYALPRPKKGKTQC